MTMEETLEYLRFAGIDFEFIAHDAVFNMEESASLNLPHYESIAKNLFIRDKKHKDYFLICAKEECKINLKEFREKFDTKPLTFASEAELAGILGLFPGAVSPLGLLNDKENVTKLCIDKALLDEPGVVGVHPNDNHGTVYLKVRDLEKLILESGNEVVYF